MGDKSLWGDTAFAIIIIIVEQAIAQESWTKSAHGWSPDDGQYMGEERLFAEMMRLNTNHWKTKMLQE